VLEGDEVFDSNLLKQTMESMIAAGRRNISVDLSQLDYLYSDAINALVVMNKRMLDVFGRLSLLAPQPPVMEILKKGGIQNILKIFTNENEILQLSQQMSGQAMPAPAAAQVPPPQPQSEFDALRSEIGSAFESGPATSAIPGMPSPALQQYAPQPFAGTGGFQTPPPSPIRPMQPGLPPQRPPFTPPPGRAPFAPPPPSAVGMPRYAPPPRPFEPSQRPPARGYTPPPPKPAPAPLGQGGETRRMPPVPEIPASLRPQIQPQEEPSPAQSEEDLEKIEASLEKKIPAPGKDMLEDIEETPKKRSSLVPMLIALVVLIIAGGGGYYAYITYFQKPPAASAPAAIPTESAPPVPQLPVEATKPAPAPAAPVAEVPEKPAPQVAVKPIAPVEPPVVRRAEPPVARRKAPEATAYQRQRTAPREQARPAVVETPPPAVETAVPPQPEVTPPQQETPKPTPVVTTPPPAPPAPQVEQKPPAPEPDAGGGETTCFIGTLPPLADVYMDGKFIGKSSTNLNVSPGTHTMRFVKGDKEFSKQMTFQPGKNPGTFVKMP
jgi:anti-anti-sigma factor